MSDTPVLFSRVLQDGQWLDPSADETIAQALREDRLAWAHIDGKHPDAADWISHELDYLDLQAREALLDVDTRPRAKTLSDGMFVILRGINFNEGEDPEDMVSVRMYIDDHRIVTVARKRVMAIEKLQEMMERGQGPTTAGEFLVLLAEDLVARISEFQSELDSTANDLEYRVIRERGVNLRQDVANLRLQVIAARRYVGPQRDALKTIAESPSKVIDHDTRREIEEEMLKMTRVAEDMDELRDQALVLREELSGQLSDQVNRNTFVLSMLSAVFLPLGFLTGLFGVNVGGMPGVSNAHAFFLLCLWCLGIFILQISFLGLWRLFTRHRK
ncbi:zinc transporter ZntB [Marivivens donghaensis]|jgi:zinc transporter|uniref:zinc transporter ZntB n=1 Tax=Marivivens donghaensis TaxID=1699413 RepID=UPI003F69795D